MGGLRGGALGKRRPRAGGAVPQSPALCARLDTAPCRLGAAQLRRARACAVVARAAGGARPGGARGEEDRPGRARCATGAGPKGGVPGWRARPGEQGARGGRGPGARQRRRKEREEREGEGKKRKERRKENGKKKRKGKRRGKEKEKREREREIRAGITALIAEPVGHAWRPGARECDARVEEKNRVSDTGVGSLGIREIRRNREDSGRLGLGFQGGISSSTTKQNFSARFTLGNFRDVKPPPLMFFFIVISAADFKNV